MLGMIAQITTNELTTAYRKDGNARGVPVLFSNSLMSDHRMWDGQIAALSDRHLVVRYDTRGHGASGVPPGPYRLEELVDDAIALMDGLGIDRAHFVGLSLGGMIGQMLAAKYPARLLSLVLSDTASEWPGDIWQSRIATAQAEGIEPLVEPTIERWFTEDYRRSQPKSVERIRAMIKATPAEGYMGCAAAIRDMHLTGLLRDISAPTLVVVGAEDPATPVSVAEQIHAGIAGSKLAVIPKAAHLPNIEQAEMFNDLLVKFLNESSA